MVNGNTFFENMQCMQFVFIVISIRRKDIEKITFSA